MQKRKGESIAEMFLLLLLVSLVSLLSFLLGSEQGHKQGAIDHADGKVVVVNLPDGRREVCEVKHDNAK